MANVTGSFIQGLLIPDPRITSATFDTALTSVTQAGPRAGVPVDAGSSLSVLAASGVQTAGTSLDVGIARTGTNPGCKWRATGDTYYRGWHPPIAVTGRQFVDYQTSTYPASLRFHAITLASGVVLAVFDYLISSSNQGVRCITLSASDAAPTWSAGVSIYQHGQALTYGSFPSAVQLPSGRVLVFYWVEIQTGGVATSVRMQMSYSDDDGATWTTGAASVLGQMLTVAAATFTPGRIRVARSGSQMMMVVQFASTATAFDDRLRQYASADLGATWAQVAELSGDDGYNAGKFHDVTALRGGGFLVATLQGSTGYPVIPVVRLFGAASHPMTAAAKVSILVADLLISTVPGNFAWGTETGATIMTDGDLTVCQDDDGTLYLYGRSAVDGTGVVVVSTDRGVTWAPPATGLGTRGFQPWYTGDVAAYPHWFAATFCRGRVVMVSRHAANPGTGDPSVSAIYLGGYSTVPIGSVDGGIAGEAINRTSWVSAWQPFDLPENTGGSWTYGATGAPAAPSFNAAGDLSTPTGAAETSFYQATPTPTATLEEGITAEAALLLTSGTADLRVQLTDVTTNRYDAAIRVSATTITLRDVVAGTTLATVTTADALSGVRLHLSVVGDNAIAWYRPSNASHDQSWTFIGETAALTAGVTDLSNRVTMIANASTAVVWRHWGYVSGLLAGLRDVVTADDLQARLCGRPLLSAPGTYVDEGVSISATGGPALLADAWTIATAYDYPATAVDPTVAPSPSVEWRSTQTASAETIAWSWHVTGTVSFPPGRGLGLYIGGANFRSAFFEGRNAAGSWVQLGEWNGASEQTALRFTRSGESLYVDTGGASSSPWYPTDSLAGSCFQLDASTSRRILANSAGTWTATTTQTPILRLEGVSGGDPASGTTGKIVAQNGLLLVTYDTGVGFNAFRVRIPGGQPTPDGYYRIGVAMLGLIHAWGREYSWGRTIDLAPNTVTTEARSGARTVRRLGPSRRSVEIAWPDGIDMTGNGGNTPTPDYVTLDTSASAIPAATPGGTPFDLLGVVDRLSGAASMVVYFDGLPITSATERMIAHPTRTIYGRIVSAPSIEQVIGREWGDSAGEILRIASVRIEEEV